MNKVLDGASPETPLTQADFDATSIEPKLWCITYETEDEPCTLFSVGVDMDVDTAEMLVLKLERSGEDDEVLAELEDLLQMSRRSISEELCNYSVGRVWFEAVPTEVDGFDVYVDVYVAEAPKVQVVNVPDELSKSHVICEEHGSADTLEQLTADGCRHDMSSTSVAQTEVE